MAENETLFAIFPTEPENITINGTSSPDVHLESNDTPFYFRFRNEPWVIPLVSLCGINIFAILFFEIYVLYKSCGGRRHLFMGQVLLLALFLCSVLGLFYVPEPHWIFCGITRAGLGLVYAVVFGTLLVKCIFLLKLHDGVYFNASYQGLLLFFIVSVEVTIVTQWLVYEPPTVVRILSSGETMEVCLESPLKRIEYLSYVMFLLFMVIVAAIRGRSLRENNKEALYIGLSIGIALVIWVAWMSVALIFDRRYEAPAEALGVVCTAIEVFLLIFLPKAVQLRNPLKGQTTGSTTGSHSAIHTPSFLRLQPHAILPSSAHGTLVKQSSVNADYCRGYNSRLWRYDCPSFHQMEAPVISSDYNSLKKSNMSYNNSHSHLY